MAATIAFAASDAAFISTLSTGPSGGRGRAFGASQAPPLHRTAFVVCRLPGTRDFGGCCAVATPALGATGGGAPTAVAAAAAGFGIEVACVCVEWGGAAEAIGGMRGVEGATEGGAAGVIATGAAAAGGATTAGAAAGGGAGSTANKGCAAARGAPNRVTAPATWGGDPSAGGAASDACGDTLGDAITPALDGTGTAAGRGAGAAAGTKAGVAAGKICACSGEGGISASGALMGTGISRCCIGNSGCCIGICGTSVSCTAGGAALQLAFTDACGESDGGEYVGDAYVAG